MLTNNELLELYRMEKRDLDDPLYGPPFPSFREWKHQYMVEYRATHVTVDVDLADQMMEDAIVEAETWLNNEVNAMSDVNVNDVEVVEFGVVAQVLPDNRTWSELTDEERAAVSARANDPVKVARARKLAKKYGIQIAQLKRGRKPGPAKVAKKAATSRADSKAAKAREYFTAKFGVDARKDIVAYFVNELGLTANGAATYYQKFKSQVGS